MNISFLQIVDGEDYKKIVSPLLKKNKIYCEKQNYPYVLQNGLIDSSRNATWNKILLITNQIPKNDWLIFLDADACIMDIDRRFEGLLNPNYDVAISWEDNFIFNAGFIIVKCTQWANDFFQAVWNDPQWKTYRHCEQECMINLYESNFMEAQNHITILKDIVSFSSPLSCKKKEYKHGDFIIHVSGRLGNDLSTHIQKALLDDRKKRVNF